MKNSAFDHLARATESCQESSVLTAAAELDLYKTGQPGIRLATYRFS